jgi:hypothetical protein
VNPDSLLVGLFRVATGGRSIPAGQRRWGERAAKAGTAARGDGVRLPIVRNRDDPS